MINKKLNLMLTVFIFLTITSSFSLASTPNENKENETKEKTFLQWLITFSRTKGVAPVTNDSYKNECGACHFPYQPGLLPSQSWTRLFDAKKMEDHFGDNAELDEDVRLKLLKYTTSHSADKSWYKRSRKIMAAIDENLSDEKFPIRITQTAYIKEKHSEIPRHLIKDNDNVNSLSYCDNCHQKANNGIYDNDTVFIPR